MGLPIMRSFLIILMFSIRIKFIDLTTKGRIQEAEMLKGQIQEAEMSKDRKAHKAEKLIRPKTHFGL